MAMASAGRIRPMGSQFDRPGEKAEGTWDVQSEGKKNEGKQSIRMDDHLLRMVLLVFLHNTIGETADLGRDFQLHISKIL